MGCILLGEKDPRFVRIKKMPQTNENLRNPKLIICDYQMKHCFRMLLTQVLGLCVHKHSALMGGRKFQSRLFLEKIVALCYA